MNEPGTSALGVVRVWEEEVVFPTYPAQSADPNPMFLEKRVYQGSSGKVYPNPFTDRVATEKSDKTYRAIMLENEYVQLMILPEIGGRIHAGLDKTNGYDFFYRQHVIKPALVGLLGPWISGGVEFNWPQHHRPSTYMPAHSRIETGADGSCTVWLSEHEPMNRMKGMVGICLHPGKSIVEAKVRLYNRTPLPQTFLWWANVAVRVHDEYQVFFPPDVHCVADHAKRALSSFPIARNFYYGVDYREGVDISWYKNIPVPTSYMVAKSNYDFFGGYDQSRHAGLVHVSNHHVAPGKKLWTWGNAEFGYAWDRNLTDEDGPYVELMAGAYTDNQPDFSWLHPYETRTFSQYWYPIQEIGPAKNANKRVAINLGVEGDCARIGVCASEALSVKVVLTHRGKVIYERDAELKPGSPLVASATCGALSEDALQLDVFDSLGNHLLATGHEPAAEQSLIEAATEPPLPEAITTNEELYLTGLHLEQYRHGTRHAKDYWLEGLKRDPEDSRLNNAMGLHEVRRGNLNEALSYFLTAVRRLTARNPNPYDGECYYNLGVTLKYLGRTNEAYDAFYKCAWNSAWQSAAYYSLASIDTQQGRYEEALLHLESSLRTNPDHLKARGLRAAILRRLGKTRDAAAVIDDTLAMDLADFRAMAESFLLASGGGGVADRRVDDISADIQSLLDIIFDFISEGLAKEAFDLLSKVVERRDVQYPIALYLLSWLANKLNDVPLSAQFAERAARSSPLYCFPARIEEMLLLQWVIRAHPDDAKALYYLGNLYYDKRRYEEAIACWRASVKLDSAFSIPWRNLGIAQFNILDDATAALECYRTAFQCAPSDARVLYEWDQLKKRVGVGPTERKSALDEHLDLVKLRDDLMIEYVTLLNLLGESASALSVLCSRKFNPWEGGEGLVSGQYAHAHLILGREALSAGDPVAALTHFGAARHYPVNLGEGKHLLTLERDIDYFSGLTSQAAADPSSAARYFSQAAAPMRGTSRHSCYQAMALRQLGREEEAAQVLSEVQHQVERQEHVEPRIDYFATSLPNMLLFRDDLARRRDVDCLLLKALVQLASGNIEPATELFRSVLELDPSQFIASAELRLKQPGLPAVSQVASGQNS